MTTDNTQDELTDDQYLRFEVLVPMYSALEKQRRENIKLGYMQDASGIYGEAIRQFLDWHNKQIEALESTRVIKYGKTYSDVTDWKHEVELWE